MGNTWKPMAVSFQCMTKFTTNKKKKKKKENAARILLQSLFVSDFMGFFLNASENGAADPNQELCFFWESWNADPCNIYNVYSVMFDSLHGLQPTRLLSPWKFSGKTTGVGCHFFLQGIFLIQGSSPCLLCLLHRQADSLPLRHLYIRVTKCQANSWQRLHSSHTVQLHYSIGDSGDQGCASLTL